MSASNKSNKLPMETYSVSEKEADEREEYYATQNDKGHASKMMIKRIKARFDLFSELFEKN